MSSVSSESSGLSDSDSSFEAQAPKLDNRSLVSKSGEFKVWVEIDDEPVEVYNADVKDKQNKVTGIIASVAGKVRVCIFVGSARAHFEQSMVALPHQVSAFAEGPVCRCPNISRWYEGRVLLQ